MIRICVSCLVCCFEEESVLEKKRQCDCQKESVREREIKITSVIITDLYLLEYIFQYHFIL